jgi:hypothetical protein
MTTKERQGSHQRRSHPLVPPLRWAGIVAAASIVTGIVVAAAAGGAILKSCKGGPCSAVPFDRRAAIHSGVEAALTVLIVGYLVIVAVRAFTRFAETEGRGGNSSNPD